GRGHRLRRPLAPCRRALCRRPRHLRMHLFDPKCLYPASVSLVKSGAGMRSVTDSRPVSSQRTRGPLGLDPVWRIEVMALLEHVEGEVGEDLARSVGHPPVVVGVAPAAKREVNGLLEGPQAVE